MQLGQTEDYAVRALVDLAKHPEGRIEEIARRTGVPAAHLAKVVQSLARAGLVETTRGRGGGVRLLLDPAEIPLRRVMEAMQGPLRFQRCPRRGKGCPLNPDCPIYVAWRDMEARINSELERVHISDLVHGPCELTQISGPGTLR